MRFSSLLLATTAMLAALSPSFAQDIPPEKMTIETLPPDMKRVYLVDLTINHVVDGKVWVLDADKMEVKGMLELGFLGLFYAPPKSDKLYIASTYYDRLTRGKRVDALTIFDANTLKELDEIILPTKRVMPIQYRPLMQGSADGKLLFIQNSTPATSITVTNLAKKSNAELPAPGCYGTYPSIGASNRVSTMCGDGTFGTYTLNAEATEGKRAASDKMFDADKDAWFIHGEKNGGNYHFISFTGGMHTVSLDGEKAKLVDSFAMSEGVEGSWRPGGYQPFAVNAADGIAYVLMHSNGAEGSHKNPSEEIWSVDLKAKKVVSRSKVPTMVSVVITGDGTLYGINPLEPSVVKMTVDKGANHAVTVAGTSKVGETATQIEVSN
jgi:methylamine dehydrogenase heavy chain